MVPAFKAHSSLAECLDIYRSNHNTRKKVLCPGMTGLVLQQRWLFPRGGGIICDGRWSCIFISGEKKGIPEEGIPRTQLNIGKRAVYMGPTNYRYKYNNLLL